MGMSKSLRDIRRRHMPVALRGKPFRRLQREMNQRLYDWPHRNLLIVGLPKSGTTWLLRMLRDVPGYVAWQPPVKHGYENHDLERRHLTPPPAGYTVSKTHTRPIDSNVDAIHHAGRPYVIQMRDLRDVAVSWAFYVRNTPDHALHERLKNRSTGEALDAFLEETLPGFVRWTMDWKRRLHPTLGMITRYEDLLADAPGELARILSHYGVSLPAASIREIAERHSFRRATGRDPGQEDAASFNRKGVAGDWVNHLSSAQRERFKRIAGEALIELGYAPDLDW